jgi:hypothetical protein
VSEAGPPRQGVLRQLGLRGCVRLPLAFDVCGLRRELEALPAATWSGAGRDPLILSSVQSFFAIGRPRGRAAKASAEPFGLAALPVLHRLLTQHLPGLPSRAIVARQRSGGLIPLHRDTPRHFRGTVRLSIQVDADGRQPFYCEGLRYDLGVGEVWAIDNLQPHGILNVGRWSRITVIVDLPPSPALEALLLAGEAGEGQKDPSGHAQLRQLTREHCGGPRQRLQRLHWELNKLLSR